MNHFFMITNRQKDPDFSVTNDIKEYLERRGCICNIQTESIKGGEGYTDPSYLPENVDCILVLGGDGTLLQAAVDLADFDIPLLGINMGTLGFLAEVEKSGIEEALDRLIADDYNVENRMMIWGLVEKKGAVHDDTRALNDIVITGSNSMQLINFNIYVNGQLLNKYYADGMIIATPTGSTGYNLSAGGPIIEPKAETILITPICPHTLNNRSIILSAEDVVTIEIDEGRYGLRQEVSAIFDGSHRVSLTTGDKIEIKRSEKRTAIIKLNQVSFLEILHRKLSD